MDTDDWNIGGAIRETMLQNTSFMDDFPTATDVARILCLKPHTVIPRARVAMRVCFTFTGNRKISIHISAGKLGHYGKPPIVVGCVLHPN